MRTTTTVRDTAKSSERRAGLKQALEQAAGQLFGSPFVAGRVGGSPPSSTRRDHFEANMNSQHWFKLESSGMNFNHPAYFCMWASGGHPLQKVVELEVFFLLGGSIYRSEDKWRAVWMSSIAARSFSPNRQRLRFFRPEAASFLATVVPTRTNC
jgi:hypothetical protein